MEFKHHFFPAIKFRLIEVGKENERLYCCWCNDIIHGPAYIPDDNSLKVMHQSCAELPPRIQIDAFHPHPLRFNMVYTPFACDGCAKVSTIPLGYSCMYCTFRLDFKCAVSIYNGGYDEALLHEGRSVKTTIHHFRHNHQLTRCKYPLFREMDEKHFQNFWELEKVRCMSFKQEVLHDTLIYTCIPCTFVLHESCVNDMPIQIVHSPFHPQHILLPQPFVRDSSHTCSACMEEVKGIGFYCNQCYYVKLHVSCATYQTRAIKHKCHPHHLLHLGKSIFMSDVSCKACHKHCDDSFFGCIKCKFYIHVQCIPLPPIVEHRHHLHQLKLVSPFVEDDSGVYYFDTCEEKRNGEHHVFYCDECKYIAHIGCALPEIEATEEHHQKANKIMGDKRLEFEGLLTHKEKVEPPEAIVFRPRKKESQIQEINDEVPSPGREELQGQEIDGHDGREIGEVHSDDEKEIDHVGSNDEGENGEDDNDDEQEIGEEDTDDEQEIDDEDSDEEGLISPS